MVTATELSKGAKLVEGKKYVVQKGSYPISASLWIAPGSTFKVVSSGKNDITIETIDVSSRDDEHTHADSRPFQTVLYVPGMMHKKELGEPELEFGIVEHEAVGARRRRRKTRVRKTRRRQTRRKT